MKPIKWREEWTLGDKKIDKQHKCLASTINKIIVNKADALKLLEEFIDYSAEHFADEEHLMLEVDYPKELMDAHKEEHKEFTNLLLDVSFELVKNYNEELANKFKKFCLDWFELHFLKTDKLLVDYIKEGGEKTNNQ